MVFALLLVLLSGCTTLVHTRVSAFHELEQPLSGATYMFVPVKEQEGNLEFKTYARLIKAELHKRGMIETAYDQATFAIFMSYGIDDGKQVVSSYPIYGQTGTGNSYTTGRVTSYGNTASYSGTTYRTPTFGIVGSGTRIDTVYARYLKISIVDNAKSGEGKLHYVYEGTAISSGQTGQLVPIMPAMVRSVFEDFPGKSGASRISRQPLEE